MCARFTLSLNWQEICHHLDAFFSGFADSAPEQAARMPPRFNIAPGQPVLALARTGEKTGVSLMRWGLVPRWVRDPSSFPLLVNARSETLAQKASFRDSLEKQRCLIPASGYYEWHRHPDGSSTPHHVSRRDGAPVFLAGLYSSRTGPDGRKLDTAVVITTAARGEMARLHHRTPVLLTGRSMERWLDCDRTGAGQAMDLLGPVADGVLGFHPVSPRVNSPKNDDRDLVAPVLENGSGRNESGNGNGAVCLLAKPAQLDLF